MGSKYKAGWWELKDLMGDVYFSSLPTPRGGVWYVKVNVCIGERVFEFEDRLSEFPSELLMTKLTLLTGGGPA